MSNLLKASLLVSNPHLNRRVHSAVMQVASEQSNAEGAGGNFARLVYQDLDRPWSDFVLHAAADQHIQAASVINEDATAIVTTEVNDEQILNVVNGVWAMIAQKYAPVVDGSDQP